MLTGEPCEPKGSSTVRRGVVGKVLSRVTRWLPTLHVCPEDAQENELSLQHGYRVLSAYRLDDKSKLWIITEADRSATTLLLPEEY